MNKSYFCNDKKGTVCIECSHRKHWCKDARTHSDTVLALQVFNKPSLFWDKATGLKHLVKIKVIVCEISLPGRATWLVIHYMGIY